MPTPEPPTPFPVRGIAFIIVALSLIAAAVLLPTRAEASGITRPSPALYLMEGGSSPRKEITGAHRPES